MTKRKRFKYPIYGYIDIDEAIILNIVDTAGFQRLRNVIQTSYSPLYSSAVHNRFVILKANQFNSGFAKDDFAKIQIEFDTLQKPCFFEKVTNTLKAERSSREKFFYLFYRRTNKENKIDLRKLAVKLGTIAMQEAFNDN